MGQRGVQSRLVVIRDRIGQHLRRLVDDPRAHQQLLRAR